MPATDLTGGTSGAEWLCSRLFACYRPGGPAHLAPNGPVAGILPATDLSVRLTGAEWSCSRHFACYRPVGPARGQAVFSQAAAQRHR
ncbi:hypothetical protein [Paenibacillus glycanilyticus]|uniref:hypothetical protein n=1 Tax=Paenibacillus glycanilyticus TaxID=126569 RepID=UPI0024E0CD9C|nr:hypothetical protein [Paenibacillus glycanilyticus]